MESEAGKMDCLFRDVYNIPVMEKVIKERFHGKYPARKSIQTNFAHVGGPDGLHFQADAVAYCGQNGRTKLYEEKTWRRHLKEAEDFMKKM